MVFLEEKKAQPEYIFSEYTLLEFLDLGCDRKYFLPYRQIFLVIIRLVLLKVVSMRQGLQFGLIYFFLCSFLHPLLFNC